MDKFFKFIEYVIKSGPWALVVVIVLTWLAGDYGLLTSQSKVAAEAIKDHVKQSERQTERQTRILESIADTLEDQRRIQAETGLISCLKEAKADWQNRDCVKKFTNGPIQKRQVP